MDSDLLLVRSERNADGTFGLLHVGNQLLFHTMEDDWRDNARGVSCIPAGNYTLVRTIFHKHNLPTFEVSGVPGRSRILIHPGNTEEDVEGCIGLGLRRGFVTVKVDEDTGEAGRRKNAVLESHPAFLQFMAAMRGQDHVPFTVKWASGMDPFGPDFADVTGGHS